jgi:MFS transporter, DHA1 family, tetracycline resistance protein
MTPFAARLTVFLVVFIDLLGFGIVLPLLPRYANTYLQGDPSRGVWLGLLYCSFSVMQFLLSPTWGRVSDRYGRRPVLLVSLAGSVVFYALFALASTVPGEQKTLALVLLLLCRIGAGAAGASVSTAAAVIADTTTPEKRSKGMALIGVAFGIGFTFGPLIAYGGLKLFPGERWAPGAVAATLSFVALTIAFLTFRETRRPDSEPTAKELFSIRRTLGVLAIRGVGLPVFVYFLVIFAFANFEGTLSVLTRAAFGMEDDDNFLVFAFVGFVLMAAQGGLYRRFAGKWTEAKLIALGVSLMLLGLAGLGAVAYYAYRLRETPELVKGLEGFFFFVLAAAVTGFAFVNPSVSALISKRAPEGRQGEVQGVGQSMAALGRILGPFVGLVTFDMHESRTLPYGVAAALLLIVVFLLPKLAADSKTEG